MFTRDGQPLSGNPLCVFEDGSGLDTATMQALARQFNLSETTFLLPSQQGHRAGAHLHARATRCLLPDIRRWAVRTCAVRSGWAEMNCKFEMQVGVIPVAARGRALDAGGAETELARVLICRGVSWRRCWDSPRRIGSTGRSG